MFTKTLLFLLTIITISASGQQLSQNIRGKITDSESEATLPGAMVMVEDVQPIIGATTDENGNFSLEKVPVGRHKIVVRLLGYQEAILNNVLVGSAKEVILNIGLTESRVQMNEVVVRATGNKHKANNEMATVSARSFSVDETQRYAASVDDPARMAQAFAGVSSTDDVSNEIIVRGNSPRGLLWRLNGVEAPSPNHFSNDGASGGGVSALSNNMLDNSDFFTGAFPAEYGNALSGVFDVKLRKGNNQQREYATQIGVLGTDLAAEGPFKKDYAGSYLINYRYSTLGLLTASGILDLADINTYQDLAFNINLPTNKLGTFSAFGLGGLSLSKNKIEKDTTLWEPKGLFNRYTFHSNLGIGGVGHQYFFNPGLYIKTAFSLSGQQIAFERDSISPINFAASQRNREHFTNTAFRISSLLNYKINSLHTLRTGFIISQLNYDLGSAGMNDSFVYQIFLSDQGKSYTYQAFAQWKYKFAEKWTLNTGTHFFAFSLNRQQLVEPRMGLQYQISDRHSLSFGVGMHSRMEPMSLYNANVVLPNGTLAKSNQNLGLSRAIHYVLGYDHLLHEHLRLKIEAYYQYLYNIPVSSDSLGTYTTLNESGGFTSEQLLNKGTSTNKGIELTLEKFFSNRYYFLLTSSIFDSKYTDAFDREFNTRYNANYRITALGGKEWQVGKNKQNIWSLNGKVIYAGGNRYTPINLSQSLIEQQTVYYNQQLYQQQVPAYWRIDMTLNYRINKNNKAHIWSLQIQNITNRINVFSYQFDKTKQAITAVDQFGLLPVLKYRLEF